MLAGVCRVQVQGLEGYAPNLEVLVLQTISTKGGFVLGVGLEFAYVALGVRLGIDY